MYPHKDTRKKFYIHLNGAVFELVNEDGVVLSHGATAHIVASVAFDFLNAYEVVHSYLEIPQVKQTNAN